VTMRVAARSMATRSSRTSDFEYGYA
jgi:hypothetical protein